MSSIAENVRRDRKALSYASGCFFLLICFGSALGLDPDRNLTQYIHRVWREDDGLPQSEVLAIAQTQDGYLWVGTADGLAKFDGIAFTKYDSRVEGLKNNYVWALLPSRDGSLWISTADGGVSQYKNGKFTAFTTAQGLASNRTLSLYEDVNGSIWIGTVEGLSRYKNGVFTNFTTKDGLSDDTVWALSGDLEGYLWVVTDKGVDRFKNGQFIKFLSVPDQNGNASRVVYQARDGSMWLGLRPGVLGHYVSGQLFTYTAANGLSNKTILALSADHDGNLWVGANGGNLSVLRGDRFITYTTKDGLPDEPIWAIAEDREGGLWLGTSAGLHRFADNNFTSIDIQQGLPSSVITAVYEGKNHSVWIGTRKKGLAQFKNGLFSGYTTMKGLRSNTINSVYGSRDGSLWVGTTKGLNEIRGERVLTFADDQLFPDSIISAVFEDSSGTLWLGTERGFTSFAGGIVSEDHRQKVVTTKKVLSFCEDDFGNVWIGTNGSLIRAKNGSYTSYSEKDGLSGDIIISLYADHQGNLWVGTYGKGLNRLRDGRFSNYQQKSGLFDDSAFQILEDSDNRLWMSCAKGIFTVNKKDLEDFDQGHLRFINSTSYNQSSGMKSAECTGTTSPAGWRTNDGRLWFATSQGVAVINPAQVKNNEVGPSVVIEKLNADKNNIEPSGNVVIAAGEGQLEIRYTAPSFIAPEQIKFKYKLQGFNKDWIEAGTRRTAFYTNLPPGNYQFKVIASNRNGDWNEPGTLLNVRLQPHFYQTTWFYALMAVAALGLATMGHRFRLSSLSRRKVELEDLVSQRTEELVMATEELKIVNRGRADFVSGVSHELKTPLTLIRLYGETLLYGEEFPKEIRHDYYEIIARESERLTHLVDSVLDFSRVERGQKPYSFNQADMRALVREILETRKPHLEQSGFTLKTDIGEQLPLVRFDAEAVTEVVSNLLDNAEKYSGDAKQISVRLFPNQGGVILEVEDKGVGIPIAERERIFEQFYRASNTRHNGGYGLGLFLVKHIMEAHGGTVELASELGQGSVFRLSFPLDNNEIRISQEHTSD
jgi:signal transduction histidine kinase/ligand-binding sensor domain-containing protein